MKCSLAWKEGLDLRQNKNSQLPGTQDDFCSLFLRSLGTTLSLVGSWRWHKVNVTGAPCCFCWEVEHFPSVPKKMSLYRTLVVLLVGHASLHTSKQQLLNYSLHTHSKNHDKIWSLKTSTWVEKGKSLWCLVNCHLLQLPREFLTPGLLTSYPARWFHPCPWQPLPPSLVLSLIYWMWYGHFHSTVIGCRLDSCLFWTYVFSIFTENAET